MSRTTSKYSTMFSRKRHERWIKEGRGMGTGAAYKGWLQYGDFPSLGNTLRHKESRHGRGVLALSKLEQDLLAVLECNPNVVAIYDQVPLNLDDTQAIATEIGVPHPVADRSRYPFVMTSDFLIDLKTPGGIIQVPIQAKFVDDLRNHTEYRKVEIERRYWLDRGLKLRLVTETPRCLPTILVANARSLMAHRFTEDHDAESGAKLSWAQRCAMVLHAVHKTERPTTLNELAHGLAQRTSSAIEDFTTPIQHLIFTHELPCDLSKPSLLQHDVLEVQQRIEVRRSGSAQ